MHSIGRGATTTTDGCTTAKRWHEDGTPRNQMLRNPAGSSHTRQRHQHRKRTKQPKCQRTSTKKQSTPPGTGRSATMTSAPHTCNTRWMQGTTHRRTGERRTSRIATDTTKTQSSEWEGKELWGHNRRGSGAKKPNPTSIRYGGKYKSCWNKETGRQKTRTNAGAK